MLIYYKNKSIDMSTLLEPESRRIRRKTFLDLSSERTDFVTPPLKDWIWKLPVNETSCLGGGSEIAGELESCIELSSSRTRRFRL